MYANTSGNDNNNMYKIPNRIFVGGIPKNASQTELKDYFSHFGHVKDARIITDPRGVSKGYGFVTYENESDATRALSVREDELIFKENKLNIGHAFRKKTPMGGNGNANGSFGHFGGIGGGNAGGGRSFNNNLNAGMGGGNSLGGHGGSGGGGFHHNNGHHQSSYNNNHHHQQQQQNQQYYQHNNNFHHQNQNYLDTQQMYQQQQPQQHHHQQQQHHYNHAAAAANLNTAAAAAMNGMNM